MYRSPTVGRSVGLSVWKVYCGNTAEWIRTPFGIVSGVRRGMSVLDGGSDPQKGRGIFGGEFGVSHCHQWGLCDADLPELLWAGLDAEYSWLVSCDSVIK